MAEPKVPIDTVVQHLSAILTQQGETISKLQTSIDSIKTQLPTNSPTVSEAIQPELDTRFHLFRTEMQDEIQTLQRNLTNLIDAKDTQWTSVSTGVQSLKTDLQELKALMLNQHVTLSPVTEHATPPAISNMTTGQPNAPFSPYVVTSSPASQIDISPKISPSTTIVLPPTASIPTFSGKSSEYPRQFLLRIEEYTRTVNHWSQDTLLRGISQFLKDDALE